MAAKAGLSGTVNVSIHRIIFFEFIVQSIGCFADTIYVELYLLRHGIAEDSSASGSDADRCLTEEGFLKTRKVAKALKEQSKIPELILHSPYVRARETAEIFAQELSAPLERVEGFRPMDAPADSLAILERYRGRQESLMVVSHEPHLGSLASLLLTGKGTPMIVFKKAGIACIDWPIKQPAQLLFLLMPKFLIFLFAFFSLPAFASEEGRKALDLYNQTARELESLDAPPFSALCAWQFPGTQGAAICEDLFVEACKDSKGKMADFDKELGEEVDIARDLAAEAMGHMSYKSGLLEFLKANKVNLPEGSEMEAVEHLLQDTTTLPEDLVQDYEDCKEAGAAAPEKFRTSLLEAYSRNLPGFLQIHFLRSCGEHFDKKLYPQELNEKLYKACADFPRIKARAIDLFREEGSEQSKKEALALVTELYHPSVKKDEAEADRSKRVAEEFCKDYGNMHVSRARGLTKKYQTEIARSEPVVNALRKRYYSERNRAVVDSMMKATRSSISSLLARVTNDAEKLARIRAEYEKVKLFWISEPPEKFWKASKILGLRVLDQEKMDDDPEDTSSWNVFMDPDLAEFKELNASYSTAVQYGSSKSPELVNMLPGFLRQLETSPMNFLSTLGHELGHKIGPEVSRTNGHDLRPEWKELLDCYRSKESMRLQRGQEDETIADYIGSEVIADALLQLPQEQRRGALVNSLKDYCLFDDGRNAHFHVNCTRPHPEPIFRVNAIIGANPRIREVIGCSAEAKGYRACGVKGGAK